ncbi:hypothetical protein Pint_21361 [Pistacia integerrima]|uniref:Uncharacterized protein n=1 Tax=Pistacia integerrima TaxID=434235 RepID=A0ACC0XFG4_9ROSI|nr:hypothetical protein Pint_21361 [Pistacia integerrima]
MGLAFRFLFFSSLDFSSPDLETTPVVAKTKLAEATPPDNFTIDVSEYEDQNLEPEKEPDDENDTPQKDSGEEKCDIFTGDWKVALSLQAFTIAFEQSPNKAKQDHDNGKSNGKARESDVIDVEFEEFCKAIEANLSIEQMVEILEVNDQDSSAQILLLSLNGMYSEWSTCTFRTKDPPRREKPVKIPDSVLKSLIKKYQMTRKWDEKLGFEEDKGSEDNHNQNNTNNATMDSCGQDCVEAVMVEKAGECLSYFKVYDQFPVYLDNKDSSTDKMDKEAELPFCVGLEATCLKKHPKRLNNSCIFKWILLSVQTFRISFEQSPKKAKQDHVNGKTNGKARESDVIDVEFEEFCKAIEANLSIEQMVEILEVNDQDSSSPNPVVVTKCLDMLFYGPSGRCPICNSKLEFDGKRYTCKGMYKDKGSEDNHNQNNTNNATMDSCGEDFVEAVTVEKAGECLSCYMFEETSEEA